GQHLDATAHYTFRDQQPPLNTPLYYRLRMLDADGRFEFSPIRQTILERKILQGVLAPNPTADDSRLMIQTTEPQELHVVVTNLLGQVTLDQRWPVEAGISQWPLSTANWPVGLYRVTVQGLSERLNMTLEKN
ncbi:MAG: hypothetical protein ABIQ93_01795, partial [Saprospiraceae bacterium]